MTNPTARAESLDDLVEEFSQRWRQGERPSVDEYAAEYPEWASEIREVFPALIAIEDFKPRRDDTPSAAPRPPRVDRLTPERLGDYRIVREIGRGGMGVVYEAEQEALGRRVAIKVLAPHLLADDKMRQRFRREAQAAAALHHTNIVPVFGVGEQDGYCYYVMQLIVGRSLEAPAERGDPPAGADPANSEVRYADSGILADLVPQLPDFRQVARVGCEVAGALEYAHAQGILHRDIKPSNLLLDPQGTVWVADFGLAKLEAAADRLTSSGDLVGTLRYMAPERFSGHCDVRSDVYSLGLTLYELLARRPAFPDTTPPNLIQLITHAEPPRLRTLVPDVPPDLETIVLKAAAPDPAHRYPTARDLADDLRRFLDDRPIRARRTTALNYLWRWCRRNRLVAGLSAAAATLLVLVWVVSVVAYVRTAVANQQAAAANREMTKALGAEREQRRQAEETLAVALEAHDRVHDRLVSNRLVGALEVPAEGADDERIEVPIRPVLSREAAPLVEELLGFYERLAGQGGDYATLRAQAARANHRIGDVRQQLGQLGQAAAAYQRAVRLYRQLHEETPDDAALRLHLTRSYNELGRVYRAQQRREDERATHAQALATLTAASRDHAGQAAYRYELARTYYFLSQQGSLLAEAGEGPRPKPPPGEFGDGRRPKPPPPGEPGAGPRPKPPPGETGGPGEFGRHPADGQSLQNALRLLEDLVKEHPTVSDYRHLLACCYRDLPTDPLCHPASGTRSPKERAVDILEQLANDHPDVPDYRHDLSETYARVDTRQFQAADHAAAARLQLEKALAISRSLVADYPKVSYYAAAQAQIYHKLGLALRQLKQYEEAERALREAVAVQSALGQRAPDAAANSYLLAVLRTALARVLIDRERWSEARPLLEAAVEGHAEVLKQAGRPGHVVGSLASSYRSLAAVLTRLGEKELAADASRKADQLDADPALRKPPKGGPRPEPGRKPEHHHAEDQPPPSGSRGRGGEKR